MDRSKRGREPVGGGAAGTTDSESTSLDGGSSFPDKSEPGAPMDVSCESTAPAAESGAAQGRFQRSVEERKVRAKVDDSPRSGSAQSVDVDEHVRPRSVKPSGGKDRHSKVQTARGLRDRRVRLSVGTAIQFYDVQDRLGFDQPSKAVEWLLNKAKHAIDELPPVAASPRAPSSALGISPFPSPPSAKSGGSPSSGGMPAPSFSTRFYHPGAFRSQEQGESTSQPVETALLEIAAKGGEQGRVESRVKARERARERERMKERATTTQPTTVSTTPTATPPPPPPPSMLRPLEGGASSSLLQPESFTYSSFTSLLQSPGSVHAPLSSLIQSLQSPHLYQPPFHHQHQHHQHQHHQPHQQPSFQLQVESSSSSSARQFQFNPSPLHGIHGYGSPAPTLPEFPSLGFGVPGSHLGGGVGGVPDSSPFAVSSVSQYRPMPSLLEEVTYMQPGGPRGGGQQHQQQQQHQQVSLPFTGLGLPLQYEPFQASYDFVSALDRGGVSSSRLSAAAAPAVYQTGYHPPGGSAAQLQGVIQEQLDEEESLSGHEQLKRNQSTSS